MEFGLSEEQQELASTVRSLLDKRADSQAVRTASESDAGYDEALWATLCEQIGAVALGIPEEYDGAGFSLFETFVVLEELGRALAPSPLLASLVAAEAVLASGDVDACGRLLPRIAAGEPATLAWSGTASVPGSEPVRASGDLLTGTISCVLDGDVASVLVVAAATDDGVALFEVDPASVTRSRTQAMDMSLRLATLTFDETPGTRLSGSASDALSRAHVVGAAAVSVLAVGCAQRALDMTVAYAKEREQFGRPIGSFQALKHRMADMLVLLEMSRSASLAASHAVSVGSDDAPRLAAVAASYTGDAVGRIAAETVQLHGGIAITWEHDAQLVFKRAHALTQLYGRPHQHRALLPL
ncbi:acyl-CoA dehydrogenase family protein [Nocardioides pacificus]